MDVGGYRLHVEIGGIGSPVVVLDAGLGGSSETWSEVFEPVSRFTSVVAYDRAGVGRSDPGPVPRTSSTIVGELHRLLQESGVPPPYVLVGHSFGGLNVRLFAHRYPDEVAGLVLVDATHEDFPSRESLLRSPGEWRRLGTSLLLVREAVRAEYDAMPESTAEVRAEASLPSVPVVVLTAGRFEGSDGVRRMWMDFQSDLAGRYPGAVQKVVPRSGHMMPFEAPGDIVDAVRLVVGEARNRRDVVSAGALSRRRDRP